MNGEGFELKVKSRGREFPHPRKRGGLRGNREGKAFPALRV
jgi:hypothetical protein